MSIDDEITNIQVQMNSLRLRKQALEIGRLDTLKEQNKALIEALEAVEWESDGYGKMYCPACDNYRTYGHKPDCKLGNAIKKVRG